MRADELLEAGDMEGKAVWVRIMRAVEELLSEGRPEGAGAGPPFPARHGASFG